MSRRGIARAVFLTLLLLILLQGLWLLVSSPWLRLRGLLGQGVQAAYGPDPRDLDFLMACMAMVHVWRWVWMDPIGRTVPPTPVERTRQRWLIAALVTFSVTVFGRTIVLGFLRVPQPVWLDVATGIPSALGCWFFLGSFAYGWWKTLTGRDTPALAA